MGHSRDIGFRMRLRGCPDCGGHDDMPRSIQHNHTTIYYGAPNMPQQRFAPPQYQQHPDVISPDSYYNNHPQMVPAGQRHIEPSQGVRFVRRQAYQDEVVETNDPTLSLEEAVIGKVLGMPKSVAAAVLGGGMVALFAQQIILAVIVMVAIYWFMSSKKKSGGKCS